MKTKSVIEFSLSLVLSLSSLLVVAVPTAHAQAINFYEKQPVAGFAFWVVSVVALSALPKVLNLRRM